MKKTVVITVNGKGFAVNQHTALSYQQVAGLAKQRGHPSVTLYQKGEEGRILHPGEFVEPVEGMVFNVTGTSDA